MKKWMWIVGSIVVALLVSAGAFYGGILFERNRQSSVQAQFFAERGGMGGGGLALQGMPGGMQGGQPPAGAQVGMGRGGAAGTVSSLDGNTLLLTSGGETTTVLLTDETVVQRLVAGSVSDLQPGMAVLVVGEPDDQGQVTAASIQILGGEAPAGQ